MFVNPIMFKIGGGWGVSNFFNIREYIKKNIGKGNILGYCANTELDFCIGKIEK